MTRDKEVLLKVLDKKSKLSNKQVTKKCKYSKISKSDINAIISILNIHIEENKTNKLYNNYRKAKSKHKVEAYQDCIKLLNELIQKVDK